MAVLTMYTDVQHAHAQRAGQRMHMVMGSLLREYVA